MRAQVVVCTFFMSEKVSFFFLLQNSQLLKMENRVGMGGLGLRLVGRLGPGFFGLKSGEEPEVFCFFFGNGIKF